MSWIGVVYISSVSAWGRIRDLVDALNQESDVEKSILNLYEKDDTRETVFLELWATSKS